MRPIKFSDRMRQDPILLAASIVMTLTVMVGVAVLTWNAFVLTAHYPEHPCAPDQETGAVPSWTITSP